MSHGQDHSLSPLRGDDALPPVVTSPPGSLTSALARARRLGCGVTVVKCRDGSVRARPDPDVPAGTLQITVSPAPGVSQRR
jgi:hypothetical protein